MMQLLVFRERVRNLYQRYDAYITPVVKFLFAFIAFQSINKAIGYDGRLEKVIVVMVMSLLCAFTPSAIMVLLASLLATLHVFSVSPILSIIVLAVLLIIYLLFVRYTPKYGYVLLAIPILYVFKIPYLVPMLLGLVGNPYAVIPTACGVIIYYLFNIIKSAVNMQVNMSVEDALQIYKFVIDGLIGNRMMIMSIIIFALILLVTYFVRRMIFDYAFEIAIASGLLTCVLGFLVSDIILNNSNHIISMIVGSIVSAIIVYMIHFFQLTLDYSESTHAQFEDDVYYYYVKAVPKVTVTAPHVNVKHINVKTETQKDNKQRNLGNTTTVYDEDDDILEESQEHYMYGKQSGTERRNKTED